MKTKPIVRTNENNMEDLESTEFSVKVTDRTFKLLLDSLYTNKIKAFMRELWSNAYDSHVAAGCASMPFDCHLPNALDPTFRVRDYGVSLSHDEMMGLYTTLMDSTKTETNEQVGSFGLGSKSPFSYVDQFTIVARKDGEKRTYQAAYNANNIPMLTLLDTVECDEAQGLEIIMAAKQEDFYKFEHEAKILAVGFDPLPEIDGATVKPIEPFYVGKDATFAIFDEQFPGISRVGVRQGCVIYPVNDHSAISTLSSLLNYSYQVIIDVPIGEVQMTPNREALSEDDETLENLKNRCEAVAEKLIGEIEEGLKSADSLLEAIKFYYSTDICHALRYHPKWRGQEVNGYVRLPQTDTIYDGAKWKEEFIVQSGKSRSNTHLARFHYNDIVNTRIVTYNDSEGLKRREMRYREFIDENEYNFRIYKWRNPDKRVIKALKELCGFTDDNFVWVGDLADPGPPKRTQRQRDPNAPKIVQGVYEITVGSYAHVSALPADYYWMSSGGRVSDKLGDGYVRELGKFVALGMVEKPVLCFSDKALERLKPEKTHTNIQTALSDFRAQARTNAVSLYERIELDKMVRKMKLQNVIPTNPCTSLEYHMASAVLSYNDREAADKRINKQLLAYKPFYPLLFAETQYGYAVDWNDDDVAWYVEARNQAISSLKP